MLKINVQVDKRRIWIPIPYFLLRLTVSIISTHQFNRFVNKMISKNKETPPIVIPPLNKREILSIVKEVKKNRGLELVNVSSKDGVQVLIKA